MTEHPTGQPEQPEQPEQPQVPPQEQPQQDQPAQDQPTTAAFRDEDGNWQLRLTGDPDQQRADLRGLTRAIALALRTDGNGGESCPDQIGGTVGQWAAEAVYA